MTHNRYKHFIEQEQLPESYLDSIEQWFVPLAREISTQLKPQKPFVLGVQGTQGSGKTTLARALGQVLEENHQLNTVQLSLDDFYLTRAERKHLAGSVHPLLETRGVPGTHDVALAHATLDDLFSLSVNSYANLPRFDKAADDRASEADWDLVNQDIDVIILEGWCLGVPAQEDDELLESVNDLEKNEDADASWRTYVNNILRDDYQPLFERVDYLTVIQAPSFEVVYEWRSLQESKLMRKFAGAERTMDSEKLNRFIQHYERITRHCLKVLPHKANTVFVLDKDHQIIRRQDKKVS